MKNEEEKNLVKILIFLSWSSCLESNIDHNKPESPDAKYDIVEECDLLGSVDTLVKCHVLIAKLLLLQMILFEL